MERSEFIERLIACDVSITPYYDAVSGCAWKSHAEYADLTGLIDFECNFKNGLCKYHADGILRIKSYRKQKRAHKSRSNKDMIQRRIDRVYTCCCFGCYNSVGHLDSVKAFDIDFLAKRFKPDIGFWRKGKGCVLPRGKRSITCLGFRCGNIKDEKILSLLIEVLKTPWPAHHTPKFVDGNEYNKSCGRRRTVRWMTPGELRDRILKEKEKDGDKISTK